MATICFPTENGVGTLYGSSAQVPRERSLTALLAAVSCPRLQVTSGFDVTAISASNGVELLTSSLDLALINGYLLSFDSTVQLTGLSNNTHYVYAQLTKSSNLVTTWSLVSNTTGTIPTDAVPLARVVVAGGTVSAIQNAKKNPGSCYDGDYTGDGSGTSRVIFLGFNPKVMINANSGDTSFWITSTTNQGTILIQTAGSTIGSSTITIVALGFTVGTLNTNGVDYHYKVFL